MIGVYSHLLRRVFRFHYHSQKVIGSLGLVGGHLNISKRVTKKTSLTKVTWPQNCQVEISLSFPDTMDIATPNSSAVGYSSCFSSGGKKSGWRFQTQFGISVSGFEKKTDYKNPCDFVVCLPTWTVDSLMVNVGKYTIYGSYGLYSRRCRFHPMVNPKTRWL